MPLGPPAVTVKGLSETGWEKKEAFSRNEIKELGMLQLILRFPSKLSRKNCNYWFRQPQWEPVIVCWVSKLATKANGEMLLSSALPPGSSQVPSSIQIKNVHSWTPANNTCQRSSPFCQQPALLQSCAMCASQCVRGRRDSPANTVCANREISTKDYCGTALYKHRNRDAPSGTVGLWIQTPTKQWRSVGFLQLEYFEVSRKCRESAAPQ